VYPGARFDHIADTVKRSTEAQRRVVEIIYLQVGINHRNDMSPLVPEIQDTLRQLKRVAKIVHYVGVSCSRHLPGRVRTNVQSVNREWRQIADGYVYPLSSKEVVIQRGDRFGIHYNSDTTKHILRTILAHGGAEFPVGRHGEGTSEEIQPYK